MEATKKTNRQTLLIIALLVLSVVTVGNNYKQSRDIAVLQANLVHMHESVSRNYVTRVAYDGLSTRTRVVVNAHAEIITIQSGLINTLAARIKLLEDETFDIPPKQDKPKFEPTPRKPKNPTI